jgi:hypothetical protein
LHIKSLTFIISILFLYTHFADATVHPQENLSSHAQKVKTDSVDGIYYSLHILWEGLKIESKNIDAIKEFRLRHKNTPIIHHISPFYSENSLTEFQIKDTLKKVFKKGDRIGVYLSGWKKVIEGADVKFNDKNSFWANTVKKDCKQCGSEIPLSNYTSSELDKIIEFSVESVEGLGFGTPSTSFVAGWDTSPEVLSALARNNIKIDFSMISPYRVSATIKYENLYQQLLDKWGYQENILAPQASVFDGDSIFQIPNNFASPGFMPYKLASTHLGTLFKAINRKIYKGSTISLMVLQSRFKRDEMHITHFKDELMNKTNTAGLKMNYLINSPIFDSPETINISTIDRWKWPQSKGGKVTSF